MRMLMLLVVVAAGTGCAAQIEHNLQRESARAISPTPYPDSVKITQLEHDALGNPRKWVAVTPSGAFDCSQEGDERHPICVKRP